MNPVVEGRPAYHTGGHPKGAVDDWYPENSPGTVSIPLPDADREGTLAFSYRGYLVWPADDRVYVVPENLGVTALVAARQRTRGETNWDLPWDGSPPGVKAA